MVKSNEPKKHHYTQSAYLKGFTNENGQLQVYLKNHNHWFEQIPDNVMYKERYYRQDWLPEGEDKNILEKYFATGIEPKGLTALYKLVESPGLLDNGDVAEIIAYIDLHRLRVPRQAELLTSYSKKAFTKEQIVVAGLEDENFFRLDFLKWMLGQSSPYLARMNWYLIGVEQGCSFITSDSPVTLINQGFKPPAEPGFCLYGTVVLFPIDRQHLLYLAHPEFARKERGATERLPDNLEVEDTFIQIECATWPKEMVDAANCVICQLAQDVVVAGDRSVLEAAVKAHQTQGWLALELVVEFIGICSQCRNPTP